MKRLSLRRMIAVSLFAALFCLLAPLSFPLGVIPVSAGTLALYLAVSVLGTVDGTLVVLLYLCLGALGLPVFAAFSGGVSVLIGPTGGYLWGYVPAALLIGFLQRRLPGRMATPVAMLMGTLLCYILGTGWYCVLTGTPPVSALLVCVVPFLIGDVLKIVAVLALLPVLKRVKASSFFLSNTDKYRRS